MSMNPNDPRTFPRYIPDDPPPGDEIGELVAQYEGELRNLDAMADLFDTTGWRLVSEQFAREAESLDKKAQREEDPHQWFLWRGQAMTLWYMMELPDRVEKLRRRLMDDYRRLVGEAEEE